MRWCWCDKPKYNCSPIKGFNFLTQSTDLATLHRLDFKKKVCKEAHPIFKLSLKNNKVIHSYIS